MMTQAEFLKLVFETTVAQMVAEYGAIEAIDAESDGGTEANV